MPSLSFIGGVIDFRDPYQADSLVSIEGDDWIFLALAENKLMWKDILKPRVTQAMQMLPDQSSYYVSMQGQVALRQSLSSFLERCIMKVPVPSNELVCMTGVSAILSNLFYCICEDGDLVLIPTPYYSAFDSDLRAFCNLRRVLVPLDAEEGYLLTVDALDAAYSRAHKATGRTPKALLLTNPHNPLGRIATRDELTAVLKWCVKKGLHLVSDEIYALSSFGDDMWGSGLVANTARNTRAPVGGTSFVSIAEVCGGNLSDHIHIIWGVSKDFGMAGVRVGMVWSQNGPLLEALRNAAKFCSISGPIQAMVAELLGDDEFVDSYILENRRRLFASCDFLLHQLDNLDIAFVMPAAGMFVWVDLFPLLQCLASITGERPDDLEAELHERLLDELHIVITPGASQHASRPGWFRICYASVPLSTLRSGMAQFSRWVADLRHRANDS